MLKIEVSLIIMDNSQVWPTGGVGALEARYITSILKKEVVIVKRGLKSSIKWLAPKMVHLNQLNPLRSSTDGYHQPQRDKLNCFVNEETHSIAAPRNSLYRSLHK